MSTFVAPPPVQAPERSIEAEVRNALVGGPPAAVYVVEPATGRVLADVSVGGASPQDPHPLGTSTKPLVLLAALQSGSITLSTEMPNDGWWPSNHPRPPVETFAAALSESRSTVTLQLGLGAPEELARVAQVWGLAETDPVALAMGRAPISLVALTEAHAELERAASGAGELDRAAAADVLGWLPEAGGLRVRFGSTGFAVGSAPEVVVGVWTSDPALARRIFLSAADAVVAARPSGR